MTEEIPQDLPEETAPVDAAPKSRLGLGVLASLVVIAAGIGLWTVLLKSLDKEYFGVTVLIGLLVGYVLREVSRRSDVPVRILAVVLTAVACVAGTLISRAIYLPEGQSLTKMQGIGPYLTFGMALVVAYISAVPSKPKKAATPPAPAEPVDDGGSVDVDG